eukprot:6464064-Amphidinium_carterae.1
MAACYCMTSRPIWSYWSNGSPPPLVRLCLQSIEAHAGSQWELHTLTPDHSMASDTLQSPLLGLYFARPSDS